MHLLFAKAVFAALKLQVSLEFGVVGGWGGGGGATSLQFRVKRKRKTLPTQTVGGFFFFLIQEGLAGLQSSDHHNRPVTLLPGLDFFLIILCASYAPRIIDCDHYTNQTLSGRHNHTQQEAMDTLSSYYSTHNPPALSIFPA